jgi:Ca2+-binding RTX toxin-like protein
MRNNVHWKSRDFRDTAKLCLNIKKCFAGAAFGSVWIGIAAAPGTALAGCVTSPEVGGVTITCDAPGTVSSVSAGPGNDTIRVISGFFGTPGSNAGGAFNGDNGNDNFFLTGGSIQDAVGGNGIDSIQLSGLAEVRNSIRGNLGNDTINLAGGRVAGNVHGDENNDTITLSGSTDVGSVFGGAGTDQFYILSGMVRQTVQSGSGDDEITIGDPGNPSAAGPSIGTSVDGSLDNDKILIVNGTMGSLTGNAGDDTIWLYGGTINGAVTGGDGIDTIKLGGVADSELIPAGSPYAGSVTSGSTATSIQGGEGDDNITLTGGTINSTGNAVTGDGGNDRITLAGLTMAGRIVGGTGNDTFNIQSGSTSEVDGGAGTDTFYLSGGKITGSVIGGDGDDQITSSHGGPAHSLTRFLAGMVRTRCAWKPQAAMTVASCLMVETTPAPAMASSTLSPSLARRFRWRAAKSPTGRESTWRMAALP